MFIEKNIVFIFPLVPILQEIKTELENDDSYIVYEIDSLSEYKQLIGILEYVITFSSDMKKTSHYLQENKQFINRTESLNIVVSKVTIPPHTFGKLQKFGLNDAFKENVSKKSISHKLESFFKRFEIIKEQASLEKQKAHVSNDVLSLNKENSSNILDTESKQRVERMLSMDDKDSDLKRKKVNMHGLGISEGDNGGNLSGRTKNNFNPAMGVFQHKKLKQLDLPTLENLKKRGKFTPVERELNRKKGILFDENQAGLNRKKLNLPDINGKGAQGKKLDLPGVDREMDWKKLDPKEEREGAKGKKLDLLGVDRKMDWKKLDPKEEREGAKGKKLDLPGVDRKMDWKSQTENNRTKEKNNNPFEEVDIERGHGAGQTEHIEKNYNSKKGSSNLNKEVDEKTTNNLNLEELSRDGISSLEQDEKEKGEYQEEIISLNKKDWGEQTLDYRQLKKQYKDKQSGHSEQDILKKNMLLADKMAQTSEIEYFFPSTESIEFLVHMDSFYLDHKIDIISYLKFIQFSLLKVLNGTVTFYKIQNKNLESLYSGHLKEDTTRFDINNWQEYEKKLLNNIAEVELPEWNDSSYRQACNQFTYPYYHQGELLGYAVAHFDNSIKNEKEAQKAELFLLCAKGIFMQVSMDNL